MDRTGRKSNPIEDRQPDGECSEGGRKEEPQGRGSNVDMSIQDRRKATSKLAGRRTIQRNPSESFAPQRVTADESPQRREPQTPNIENALIAERHIPNRVCQSMQHLHAVTGPSKAPAFRGRFTGNLPCPVKGRRQDTPAIVLGKLSCRILGHWTVAPCGSPKESSR